MLPLDVDEQLLAEQRVGEVAGEQVGAAEVLRQRFQPVGAPRGEDDVGARGGEHPGELGAEPGRGTGDERDAPVEAEDGR